MSIEARSSTVKRQLLSDENGGNVENKTELQSSSRIPLSPKQINQNGKVLKVDPRHPMKKRILAYNQLLMKENQDKSTENRSILPPVNGSPKRKLNLESSPESLSLQEKSSMNKSPSPRRYTMLKDASFSEVSLSQNIENFFTQKAVDKSDCTRSVRERLEPVERWNGALALMQLASSPPSRKFSNSSSEL